MEGWIKLHRSISTWKWITSPNHVLVFIQILVRANYKETMWRTEKLMPGQLLTGIKQLKDVTGLSEMKVRRCLRDLASTSEITIKSTNKYSVITVLNWESYQESIPQETNKEQTNNIQTTASKKDNKSKKEKKNNILLEHAPLSVLFSQSDEIQEWLLTGTEASQNELLQKYSHHVLAEEIKKAYLWQLEKVKRQAGTFLVTWMGNKKTSAYMPNSPKASFKNKTNGVTATPENPTGNPYIHEAREKGLIA